MDELKALAENIVACILWEECKEENYYRNRVLKMLTEACNTRTPELPDPCSVEQWEKITGEKLPKDTIVRVCYGSGNVHIMELRDFYQIPKREWVHKKWCYVAIPGKPAPKGRRE